MTRTVQRNRLKLQRSLARKMHRATLRNDVAGWDKLLDEAQRLGFITADQVAILRKQRETHGNVIEVSCN